MTKLEELARKITDNTKIAASGRPCICVGCEKNIETYISTALKPLLEEMYDVAETLDDLGGNFAGLVIKLRPMLAEWYEPEGHERGER